MKDEKKPENLDHERRGSLILALIVMIIGVTLRASRFLKIGSLPTRIIIVTVLVILNILRHIFWTAKEVKDMSTSEADEAGETDETV